ncbi:hypothetical protein GCM10023214_43150 [Amycolatopsis dongchuanensis]|uniref:Secreted protein n=1 Tax=Amycolatopsis dongchuanensis TaxID=1070866 RepID=A0ABP9QVA1_9PSEU
MRSAVTGAALAAGTAVAVSAAAASTAPAKRELRLRESVLTRILLRCRVRAGPGRAAPEVRRPVGVGGAARSSNVARHNIFHNPAGGKGPKVAFGTGPVHSRAD